MPHDVASDLGVHCLHMTLLQVSRSEWVKVPYRKTAEFANSIDQDEVAHHEPPHLDLHRLTIKTKGQNPIMPTTDVQMKIELKIFICTSVVGYKLCYRISPVIRRGFLLSIITTNN